MTAMRNPTPQGPRSAVSSEIRALMGRHRVSQTTLAEVCGMSQPSLSARLSGTVAWDVDDLDAIAKFFHIPVAGFFSDEERPYSSLGKLQPCSYTNGQMELPLGSIAPSLELVKVGK